MSNACWQAPNARDWRFDVKTWKPPASCSTDSSSRCPRGCATCAGPRRCGPPDWRWHWRARSASAPCWRSRTWSSGPASRSVFTRGCNAGSVSAAWRWRCCAPSSTWARWHSLDRIRCSLTSPPWPPTRAACLWRWTSTRWNARRCRRTTSTCSRCTNTRSRPRARPDSTPTCRRCARSTPRLPNAMAGCA